VGRRHHRNDVLSDKVVELINSRVKSMEARRKVSHLCRGVLTGCLDHHAVASGNMRRDAGAMPQNAAGAGVVGAVSGEAMKERVPLLFVDVNLGSGRTERITVFEGDRSEDLAARFAAEHSTVPC
jgi:hypothetical protein